MTTPTPTTDKARAILAAAGIDTAPDLKVRAAVRAYRAAEADGLPDAPAIPLRLGSSGPSATVDAWQAKVAGPVLDRLAAAAHAFRAAGWQVVRVTPDRFRADPPEVTAARVAADQASYATRASGRLDELAEDLAGLVAVLPVGGVQHRRASAALAALRD